MINYWTNTCKFKIDKINYSKCSLEQCMTLLKINLYCILNMMYIGCILQTRLLLFQNTRPSFWRSKRKSKAQPRVWKARPNVCVITQSMLSQSATVITEYCYSLTNLRIWSFFRNKDYNSKFPNLLTFSNRRIALNYFFACLFYIFLQYHSNFWFLWIFNDQKYVDEVSTQI